MNDQLLAQTRELAGVSEEQWDAWHTPWRLPAFSFDRQTDEWAKNPGWRLIASNAPSLHVYGGSTYRMPPCAGCGHPIHEWFCIDLRELPDLANKLSPIEKFPLLSCCDCSMFLGRHDYEMDLQTRSLRLVNVGISRQFGRALCTVPHFAQQHAKLEQLSFPQKLTQKDRSKLAWPQCRVGGNPFWIQGPQRIFCRTCRREMTYVASLTSTEGFNPRIAIDEDGLLYHFACPECRTLSVINQNT